MVKISPLRLIGFDPAVLFRKLSAQEKNAAYFTSGVWTVIAWNPSRTIAGTLEKVLKDLKKSVPKFRRKTDLPFTGGAIGWVSYDAGRERLGVRSRHPKGSRIPDACFHVYDSAVLFDGKRVVVVGDAQFRDSVRDIHQRMLPASSPSPIAWSPSLRRGEYLSAFRAVQRGIREGDYYQMNLTYPFTAVSEDDPRTLFGALLTHNPAPASSYIEYGASALISASPERFVLIENGVITTSPIKGTRPRGGTQEEDQRFVRELLRSPKEQAELNMITDLLRNDIGKVSEPGSVHVRGYRLIQKNPSVWHTYSVIEGTLSASVRPLDAFVSMLAPGSVTGCPKVSAMESIDALEPSRRGLYCGTAVMLSSSGRLDSTVLIRSIVKEGDRLTLGTGGGIVADSVATEEFAETQKKVARILSLPVRRTWINGKEVRDDPRLRVLDPSRSDTSGVFETMRAESGRILHRALHLARLRRSAAHSGLRLPPLARIRAGLASALETAGETSLRIKLVIASGDVIVETKPLQTDPQEGSGIAVSVTSLERTNPEAKALPYHREWGAYREACSGGFRETLLRGSDGRIPEAAISNLFYVKRGTLFTARSGMLSGVTRSVILRHARSLGIRIVFRTPAMADLLRADEVFLTRSLVGILPVTRIGNARIGQGRAGRITLRLKRRYTRFGS